MMTTTSIEQRIDRLESLDAIRQLPAKYALALDMRDMEAMVSLFPADVRVGKDASGRQALRAYMDRTLRSPFTGTSHHIGGHVIEFDDADHAHGVVYSKNEHETGDEWVIMQMMYVDDYVRAAGPDGTRWYFARRLPLYYALRAKDLAYNFLPLTWRMWRGDTTTQSAVLQTAELDGWLSTPTPPYATEQEPTDATTL